MNFSTYAHQVGYNHAWAMDRVHIEIINTIAMGGYLRNVLEVGSFMGASASAWVDAMSHGREIRLACLDIRIRASLHWLRKQSDGLMTVQKGHSLDHDYGKYDCIVLDGDHRQKTVEKEQKKLHEVSVPALFAHDVNCHNAGWRRALGPHNLAESFRHHGEYATFTDCNVRKGMKTERGLFFACKRDNADLTALACHAFLQAAGK